MRDTGILTPSQTIRAANKEIELFKSSKESAKGLPEDFSSTISLDGLAWLAKYNVTTAERDFYGFGYSSRYNRLVLPLFNMSGLIGWQGRALGKITSDYPKYMTFVNGHQPRFWFDSRHGINTHREYEDRLKIVLVEDIVSAVKVGRQYRTLGLIGSYIREEMIVWFLKVHKLLPNFKIYIWLDPDKHTEAHLYAGKLRKYGLNAVVVSTACDPKEANPTMIHTLIGG
jgi:hypothetical protein